MINRGNKNTNSFYVYIYLDPRKRGKFIYDSVCFLHEPFYVGKGHGNRANTLLAHNSYCKNKILKFNYSPLVVYFKRNITEDESFSIEKRVN